ncbi:MAG: hypothetical protein AABW92_00045, partial [Nanoarchaeota archaeon]
MASPDLLIRTIDSDTNLLIIGMEVIQNTSYYSDYYNLQNEPSFPGYKYLFLNNQGKLLKEVSAQFSSYSLIPYTQEIQNTTKIRITLNQKLLSEKEISSCNYNNVCEPCSTENCITYENELTCSDCLPSSEDGFCNVKDEGICDLDCVGYVYDEEPVTKTCYEEQFITNEDIDLTGKSCADFSWQICDKNQKCEGDEIFLEHNNATCCQTECVEKPPTIINIQEKDYKLVAIILSILLIFVLIYFIKKKNIITISLFALLIVSSFFLTFNTQNNITGHVALESQQEQTQKICDISKKYNIPGKTMLAVAYKESSIQHYNSAGIVKVSPDGGVGITQRQWGGKPENLPAGPLYICGGNSIIDGRQLDAKKLDDNIECGAIELLKKCNTFNCMTNTKEYYCANADNPLPEKRVIYSGINLALRAYNGWGCESNYYRKLWGANSQKYINLISRIQNYVEDFNNVEKQFEGVCTGSVTEVEKPQQPQPKQEPTESAAEITDEI